MRLKGGSVTPTIRPYRPEDRAAAKRVYYRAVREGAAAFYSEAERAAWAPSPNPDWSVPDKLLDQWCYVAEDEGGRMIGFLSMDKTGYLDMAFVVPEVMGKGTAGALYDVVVAQARGARVARLTVRASHQSHRFLARRGWQVDRCEKYQKDGQAFDVFHMSLDLPESTAKTAPTRAMRTNG
jgi:putative acetyltransferase